MRRRRKSRPTFRADEREARHAIAAALWVESLTMGTLLGTLGGVILVVGDNPTWNLGWILLVVMGCIVVGGGFGFIVGQIVGLTLALIATLASPRSRVHVLRVAIPFVALVVSVSPVVLMIGHMTTSTSLFTAFDVALTLMGASWVSRRYRRLEARWEQLIGAQRRTLTPPSG